MEGIEPGASAEEPLVEHDELARESNGTSLIESFASRDSKERTSNPTSATFLDSGGRTLTKDKQKLVRKLGKESATIKQPDDYEDTLEVAESDALLEGDSKAVDDFNQRIAEQQTGLGPDPDPSAGEQRHTDVPVESTASTASSSGVVQNAFDRMRPRRISPEVATITIGSKTTTSVLGSVPFSKRRKIDQIPSTPARTDRLADESPRDKFSSSMRSFAAPGSQLLKTVGKPQSKVRISMDYSEDSSQDEVSARASDTESAVSDAEAGEQDQASAGSAFREDLTNYQPDSQQLEAKSGSDVDLLDEEEKKSREDAKVAELIRQAEESSAITSQDNKRRAYQVLKATGQKDSTVSLIQVIDTSVQRIQEQLSALETGIRQSLHASEAQNPSPAPSTEDTTPEDRLSLTVSKSDFLTMQVAGQFNLGFILATRKSSDLFIIDQHASDEKYNFERLQATTVVQNQRLVHPHPLQLTAIEEEIVLEHQDALLKNGFVVDIDTSGDLPVGQRCHLLFLPMSKEVTFSPTDLEELLILLADSPTHNPSSTTTTTSSIPRPSKVRRMFAMRACRSSIMIGKTLTMKQMQALVRKMGGVDKPWNCPHGRPTMRHVCGLEGWAGWKEGDGVVGLENREEGEGEGVDWKGWVEERTTEAESQEAEEEEEEEVEEEGMVEGSEEGIDNGEEEEEQEEDADADE